MKKKTSIKYLLFFVCLLLLEIFVVQKSTAQMVYMPDPELRLELWYQGYDSCMVGDSIDASCPLVINTTELWLSPGTLTDLRGIEAFVNLRELDVHDNYQLTSMPPLPDSLIVLHCPFNAITNWAPLPNTLIDFWCTYNGMTSLPLLPASLKKLSCSENHLTQLPVLPASLEELVFNENLIDSLDPLPDSLRILVCYNNQLSNLPALPPYLRILSCGNNLITTLPSLPDSLSVLICNDNQIVAIPELPDSLYDLFCVNNPNLLCLPKLNKIEYLYFSNTGITCLPNYGTVTNSNPPLSSIPLCGVMNENGCSSYYNISGRSYFDENLNCIFDSLDTPQKNERILLYKNGMLIQQEFTGDGGNYSFDVNDSLGIYEVRLDTLNIPFEAYCPVSAQYNDTITSTDSLFYHNDFALKCKPTGFDLGAWNIYASGFRPARLTTALIQVGDISNFYAANCANGISGVVTVTIDGPALYISPAINSLTPTYVSGDSLVYLVTDFGLVNSFTSFNSIVQTDTFAVLGSQVCFTVSVTPTTGDNNVSNNSLNRCYEVRGSFDPNEKEVDPPADMDVNGSGWLTYTIRFQNTGTAYAENIYIVDTLDPDLDLSTFQLLAYSHQPLVQILDGGIARFNFPNINLLDSNSNEPLSHGYIQYKVKLKNNLTLGTQVQNTAYIYFDYNTPVVTNTTLNTVVSPVGIHSAQNDKIQVSIYPNPTKGTFTVYGLQFAMKKIELFNVVGEKLFEKYCTKKSKEENIDMSKYSSGLYFVKVFTEEGAATLKVVKE